MNCHLCKQPFDKGDWVIRLYEMGTFFAPRKYAHLICAAEGRRG